MNDFTTLGISEPILRAIGRIGFTTPTPVQKQTIPLLLDSNQDVVALARTGTGKTAAFGIPLLQKLTGDTLDPEALVLSPTRELCRQITKDLQSYSTFMEKAGVVAVYGGASIELQIKDLRARPRVIVATPGRLIDHMKRGTIKLDGIKTLVLDEADEMLSMGFRDELETILSTVPVERQICMFSATMSHDVRSIASRHLKNHSEIAVTEDSVLQIEHKYTLVHAGDRIEALRRFVASEPDMYGIVFCRTRDTAREVADVLSREGCNADALHGELSQGQRDYVMSRFRKGYIKLLVATDVAARGLDINGLSHVLHLGLPEDPDAYVHRSGRTGRAGKSGISIAVISPRERMLLRTIEKRISTQMKQIETPDGNDILTARISRALDKIELSESKTSIPEHLLKNAVERLASIPAEALAKGFLSYALGDQIGTYANTAKLRSPDREVHTQNRFSGKQDTSRYSNRNGNDRRRGREDFDPRARRTGEPGFRNESGKSRNNDRFAAPRREEFNGQYIEAKLPLGESDGLTRSMVLDLVNKKMGHARFPVGKIRIMKHFSVIEVPEQIAKELAFRFAGGPGGKPGRK